ncbi:MAG: radical SAM family heme chaperone HemW [Cyanobacteriota bacterium SKYGB_h_bin112]|nr:radical SAM family heme chaperone HemW [Cyanobacteriota bacterium SKYGB_h_bin112]
MQLGLRSNGSQPHVVVEAPIAAYLHIPFCRRRCYYCDFPVSVVGDRARGSTSGTIQRYVEVLSAEIQGMGTIVPPGASPLQTVFFGGGTPSLLAPEQLDRLLTSLHQQFGIATGAEITIEMDPGTFDLAHIRAYQQAGINRVSLGVQAFQHDLLNLCGRTHTVADIYDAVDCLHQAGIENISLDLISGLPYQTLDQWQESLEKAIALAPTHLSCYDLIVEPKTAFSRRYQPGETPLPTEAIAADMYRLAQQLLTSAGYRHYEISNYARDGYECRHNQVYWRNQPYYGFGMGAASYLNGWRFTRPRKTQDYFAWVEAMLSSCQFPIPPCPQPPDLLETLMLALRTAEGISLDPVAAQYGTDAVNRLWNCLQPYYHRGLVVLMPEGDSARAIVPPIQADTDQAGLASGYRLRLQDPEGFLVSNTILADLFAALE